jgi:hypothetical protein
VSEEAFNLKAGLSFIQVGIIGKLAILQVRVYIQKTFRVPVAGKGKRLRRASRRQQARF